MKEAGTRRRKRGHDAGPEQLTGSSNLSAGGPEATVELELRIRSTDNKKGTKQVEALFPHTSPFEQSSRRNGNGVH